MRLVLFGTWRILQGRCNITAKFKGSCKYVMRLLLQFFWGIFTLVLQCILPFFFRISVRNWRKIGVSVDVYCTIGSINKSYRKVL